MGLDIFNRTPKIVIEFVPELDSDPGRQRWHVIENIAFARFT
jgi:hypothetical protein